MLTTLPRLYGRSPRGTQACTSAPSGHWTQVTIRGGAAKGSTRSRAWKGSGGALRAEGIIDATSVEAAISGSVFYAYLERVLLPDLRRTKPNAVLVMDNLPVYKAPQVRALLDVSDYAYRHLSAYSPPPTFYRCYASPELWQAPPDLNPIEPAWAKVKAVLRCVDARTASALHEAPRSALARITLQDTVWFFRYYG